MRLDDPVRIEALQRSGLLERSVAKRLDHLVFSAARLVMADAAQINGLDGDTQYTAIAWPPGDWPDIHTEDSGCRQVILTGEPFVVDDSKIHPVTCLMPWANKFRGYLGVPVYYEDVIIGTLCVLSHDPRMWKHYDVLAVEGVSRLVGLSLEEFPRRRPPRSG